MSLERLERLEQDRLERLVELLHADLQTLERLEKTHGRLATPERALFRATCASMHQTLQQIAVPKE